MERTGQRHARPAAFPVVAVVIDLVVRRHRVVVIMIVVRVARRRARIEEAARPHRDAGGAPAGLVDDRDALGLARRIVAAGPRPGPARPANRPAGEPPHSPDTSRAGGAARTPTIGARR